MTTYVAAFYDADDEYQDGSSEFHSKSECLRSARATLMSNTYAYAMIERRTPFVRIDKTLREGPALP